MMEDLKAAPERAFANFHGCAHNPIGTGHLLSILFTFVRVYQYIYISATVATIFLYSFCYLGIDPTINQRKQIPDVVEEKNTIYIPFFDCAYQGWL